MAKQVQFRRGTTSQHSTFTGAVGEITVDTDKNTAVVHDGSTAGGHPLATSLADLGVTASAADLNATDVTTLGTVEASKVVTADASGNITSAGSINIGDGAAIRFGSSNDLSISHDGSNSYINELGTGDLVIQTNGAKVGIASSSPFEWMVEAETNGAVTLYYDNAVKFATTSVGADVTGELIADSYNETYAAVTSSSNATTVDCEAGNAFSHTLTENTTFTFSNPPASGTAYSFSIEIIQDASASGYTVTWPSSVDWPAATAPTLTATASAKDVFIFTTRDGGSNWYGFTAGQALG
jgi:hypothetical protein